MEDAFGREVTDPQTARAVAVIWWVVAAGLALDTVVQGSWPSAGIAVLVLLLTMVGAFAFWWRPALIADDAGITLHNPLRDVRVPWPEVIAVGGRWTLDVRTESARYVAYAAAPARRPRRSRKGSVAPVVTSGLAERLSDRWERRRLSAASGPVEVRWCWEVLVPAAALALALLAIAATAR